MTDQVEIRIPKTSVSERSAFTATAYFRTRASNAAATPSTVRYRIDDLDSKSVVRDWTTATPGTSVAIAVTAGDNAIVSGSRRRERKQLIVQADHGTDTQITQRVTWLVRNLQGVS